jgi:hypothetical protein
VFGFTYVEPGPPRPYHAAIDLMNDGPFVHSAGEIAIGQWELTPDESEHASRRHAPALA